MYKNYDYLLVRHYQIYYASIRAQWGSQKYPVQPSKTISRCNHEHCGLAQTFTGTVFVVASLITSLLNCLVLIFKLHFPSNYSIVRFNTFRGGESSSRAFAARSRRRITSESI